MLSLGLPVLLVIDCRGMHRTIASLINGIVQFDPEISFSGVVLNNIRSARHTSKIESAINEYCDVNVLGVIPETLELRVDERELGLIPAPDHPSANEHIDKVANVIEASARTWCLSGAILAVTRSVSIRCRRRVNWWWVSGASWCRSVRQSVVSKRIG